MSLKRPAAGGESCKAGFFLRMREIVRGSRFLRERGQLFNIDFFVLSFLLIHDGIGLLQDFLNGKIGVLFGKDRDDTAAEAFGIRSGGIGTERVLYGAYFFFRPLFGTAFEDKAELIAADPGKDILVPDL